MVMGTLRQETDLVVIGGGPGGYVAALRAADLGKEVILIEERERLGGVCLLEGCIPSKTLLHVAQLSETLKNVKEFGINLGEDTNTSGSSDNSRQRIDILKLRNYSNSVVNHLSNNISGLMKKKGVEVIQGQARFEGPKSLSIEGKNHLSIDFNHCIIATGSKPRLLSSALGTQYNFSSDSVWTSTEALSLPKIPSRLVVVGGGYIGLELGTLYANLGSEVTLIESLPQLLTGIDQDLVNILLKNYQHKFKKIYLESKLLGVEQSSNGLVLNIENKKNNNKERIETDNLLISIGREANIKDLSLEKAGIHISSKNSSENLDPRILVDEKRRTKVPNIFAIGDVTAGPMLAHKAMREGKVAAEIIAGLPSAFDNQAIPAAIYTHPEIATVGLTELDVANEKRNVIVGRFPLRALGRAYSIGQTEGMAKIITDANNRRILGVGIVGANASDLITEATLAIELGATLDDLLLTIHPHPSFSEAILEAAEIAAGISVHTTFPERKK
ncbi:MAG: dihydrolipoyl dehydrogenase [Oligoflexia bacterium]|nr:dihydrolipoyl dehydrogenase [Oligoflexia bacterium]